MNSILIKRMAAMALKSPKRLPQTRAAQSLLPMSSLNNSNIITDGIIINNNNNTKTRTLSSSSSSSYLAQRKQRRNNKDSVIATGPDGTKYDIPLKPLGHFIQKRHAPKLKPRFKTKRISALKTATGSTKNIRHSPWRLNLICQFVAGQTIPDALLQLNYCEKVKAPLVASLLNRTVNTAKQKHGLLPSQLEVAECFATHGTHLKRVKIMGRGRAGKKLRRHSHMRLVLREIDFPLKIMMSRSRNERDKWVKRMEVALEDKEVADREREEIERLELELEEAQKKKLEAEKK